MNTTRRRFLSISAGAVLAAPAFITSPALAADLKVRRDVQAMPPNDPFFKDYGDAITAMHELPNTPEEQRNWRNQALIHLNYCPHGNDQFFPWHRWYILFYEQICQQLLGKEDFTLPYWNWSANQGTIPDPFYANGPLNVTFWRDPSNASSPNWDQGREVTTVGTRGLPQGVGVEQLRPEVFSQEAIDGMLALTDYTLFRQSIEGDPHNTGHVLVGLPNGHMISGMSPLDPIFWLHHCNVDRLWAEWQSAGNTTPPIDANYDNQFVNGAGEPQTGITAEGSYDFTNLGYTYETLIGAPPVASGALLRRSAEALADFSLTKSEVIGSATNSEASTAGKATNLKVTGQQLLSALFSRRTFRATKALSVPRNAVEGRRILARFSDIQAEGGMIGILVNIYVNPPDDPLETTPTSKHYAGTFSFFGFPSGGHSGNGGYAFIIDITRALRDLADEGLVFGDQVDIQLFPEALDPRFSSSTFKVGKIELIST